MVTGSRTSDSRVFGLDDETRKKILSIKEIVGNHSDADIYTALKEANMDADEAVQKMIHQDTFHEVKRKRDRKKEVRKKEDTVFVGPIERKKPLESVTNEVKVRTQPEYNVQRGGYSRKIFPRNSASRNAFPRTSAAVSNREFRVVRDNRSNPKADEELKHSSAQSSGSNISKMVATVNKKRSAGDVGNHRSSRTQNFSDGCNAQADVRLRQAEISPTKKELSDGKQTVRGVTLPSTISVLGVYSSSTDPVHVPSPVSRSSPVGAIKREVRGGGFSGKPFENVGKDPSVGSLLGSNVRKNGPPNAYRPSSPSSKIDHSETTAPESVMHRGVENNRSSLNRQRGNRGSNYGRTRQQIGGHTKGVSQNKEWKPKSNKKPVGHNPGVIGTPTKSQVRCPADNSVESEAAMLQDKLSHFHISESQNVIIADHIRVPKTDRCQLTFGSFVQEFDSSRNSASAFRKSCSSEELKESDHSSPITCHEASTDGTSIQPSNIRDDHVRISESHSPVSAVSESQLPEQKEAHKSDNLDEYLGIQLVNRNGPSYTPLEFEQQQEPPELQKFSQAYGSYDFPYFSPAMDETVRGQGLPSPHEALGTQMVSNAASFTIPMLQQQQQQASMQQMYQQVHVSHFPNLMPYRQFLSPVYVPQMPMPGYSGNPAAYVHPSNGSSYVLMPGSGSHLGSNDVKYGIHQQFKPAPTGGPTGFGTYNNPNGYPFNSPNVIGNTMGHEDSSRMKYKDGNIYVPNPQAETSEIWMQNPRDLPSLQSPYYNVAGQTPHGTYLSSHTSHPSFNAAAAAAQSSHIQFQGLFHPSQPGTMANQHHIGSGLGGNVGVGVVPSPPPSQVGPYQQSQLGHPNWLANL